MEATEDDFMDTKAWTGSNESDNLHLTTHYGAHSRNFYLWNQDENKIHVFYNSIKKYIPKKMESKTWD